ncbi:MAG: flagellar basal body L-ring protein FlgH [Limisphaerales bacterium]
MKKRFASIYNPAVLGVALMAASLSNLTADSLWEQGVSRNICGDKKAAMIGDILTILIQENNGATRQNNTTTSKKSSLNAGISSVLYSPSVSGLLTKKGTLPAINYSSDAEFNGGGSINNAETITAQVSVKVVDVLPNGNMVVEGQLHTAFSGEKQDAIVRGTVRPDDVMANNTLYSYNIADATIQFMSKGTISDAQRKGWFAKIWDKVTPF